MTIVESYFVPTDSKCDILLNVKDLGITQYVFTLSSHCEHLKQSNIYVMKKCVFNIRIHNRKNLLYHHFCEDITFNSRE